MSFPLEIKASRESASPASEATPVEVYAGAKKDLSFYMVFLSLCITVFLSALDLTSLSNALPTIAADLHITEFTWIGSAYALSSTAFLPLSGSMASIFGRRSILISSIIIFMVGSAMTASSHSLGLIVAGRTIQGIGGGGIIALVEIIVSDMVSLSERGLYMGIIGCTWALASAIGPILGGIFAQSNWRWLFWMNLPIGGVAIALALFFLNFKVPTTTFREKMRQIDWIGNALFITASTLVILGLTWGGGKYSWTSAAVLVPLLVGLLMLVAFFLYEWSGRPVEPTVPKELLQDRTAIAGYVATMMHGLIVLMVIYYFPLYFQASKGHNPIRSGIDIFTLSFTIAPFAICAGAWIGITKKYKIQNAAGWIISAIGLGTMILIKAESSTAVWVITPLIAGVGLGLLYTATTFPVLAPIPIEKTAHAMAFFSFARSFGQVLGITIGSVILQNQLNKHLPTAFVETLGDVNLGEAAFAAIPMIKDLEPALRSEVRSAFADSISTIWAVTCGLCAIGILATLAMKNLPLADAVDHRYALEMKEKASSASNV